MDDWHARGQQGIPFTMTAAMASAVAAAAAESPEGEKVEDEDEPESEDKWYDWLVWREMRERGEASTVLSPEKYRRFVLQAPRRMKLCNLTYIDDESQYQDPKLDAAYNRYRMRATRFKKVPPTTAGSAVASDAESDMQVGGGSGGEPSKTGTEQVSPTSPPASDAPSTPIDLSMEKSGKYDHPPPVLRPPTEAGRRIPLGERRAFDDNTALTSSTTAASALRQEFEKAVSAEKTKKERVEAAMSSEGRLEVEKERRILEGRRKQWGGGSSALIAAATGASTDGIFTQFPTPGAPPTPPSTPASEDDKKDSATAATFTFVDEGPAEQVDLKQRRRRPPLRRIMADIGNNRFFEVRTKEWFCASKDSGGGGKGTPSSGRYQVAVVGRKYKGPDGSDKEFAIEIPPSSFDLLIDAINECRGIGGTARKQQRKELEEMFNSTFDIEDDTKYQ